MLRDKICGMSIGKASKMPVTAMINTWLKQPGFPLLEINQDGNNLKNQTKTIPA